MKKVVNIVAIKDNWILHEIAQKLEAGLPYVRWTEKPLGNVRLTYFINYVQAPTKRVSEIECALFTHIEERSAELVQKWNTVAETTDVAVCMSEMYARKFKRTKARAIVIPPGVDINKFTQRPVKIGVIGSVKTSGRKGEDLIKSVMDIPGIEWRFTGGSGWPGEAKYLESEELPRFYADLDFVLIASYYEGGPMSAIEALASGVPIISTEVGWVPELPHISFKIGDEKGLRKILYSLVGEHTKLRTAVQNRTWDNFIDKHDILFGKLLELPEGNLTKQNVRKILSGIGG
jgi:hypothetical protein